MPSNELKVLWFGWMIGRRVDDAVELNAQEFVEVLLATLSHSAESADPAKRVVHHPLARLVQRGRGGLIASPVICSGPGRSAALSRRFRCADSDGAARCCLVAGLATVVGIARVLRVGRHDVGVGSLVVVMSSVPPWFGRGSATSTARRDVLDPGWERLPVEPLTVWG